MADRSLACLAACCLLLALPGGVGAQATPSTEQMIEQLKPQQPRTRGLSRNLLIERAPETTTSPLPSGAAPVLPAAAAPEPLPAPPVAALAAQPAPVPVRPSLSLLIQFDFDSARVRPESQQALSNLAQALQSEALAASRFAVEGHTDAKGSADYNQRLSQRRAEAVRDYLGQQGVAAARLVPAGKGASELANPGEPFAAENRRVRIVNLD